MIALDELLIKVGVDASQAKQIGTYVDMLQTGADKLGANANAINSKLDSLLSDVSESMEKGAESAQKASSDLEKASKSADKASGQFSKLKIAMTALVAGAILFGNRIASAFNSAVDNAKKLFESKNSLYQISQDEIRQVDEYKRSLDKTSLSIDSIKTKIAINLIPTITAISEKFNGWLVTNKDFITNGITKVVSWLGKGIQVITNFIKFIDKVVRSTTGWKNAFIALGVAWAVLNRAFLFSPIGLVIAAFGALLLLIDDLIVYMNGGKSLFGSYWDPLIEGTKSIIDWFNSLSPTSKNLAVTFGGLFALLMSGSKTLYAIGFTVGKLAKPFILLGKEVFSFGKIAVKAFKMIGVAIRVLTGIMIANPLIAILTAIAAIAYLIYDNWDWLCAKFKVIWSSISNFAKEAWDKIVSFASDAIKDVLMYFGMSEEGADQTIQAMKDTFKLMKDFILQPFKDAWELVKKLFNVWTDDSTSVTDKLKQTFFAIYEFIVSPFRRAMKWINDTFNGFIDKTLGKVADVLSYIGIDVDWGKNEIDALPEAGQMIMGAAMLVPNVPNPSTNQSTTTTNNVDASSNIIINANDSIDGAKMAADSLYAKQAELAKEYTKSGIGG